MDKANGDNASFGDSVDYDTKKVKEIDDEEAKTPNKSSFAPELELGLRN